MPSSSYKLVVRLFLTEGFDRTTRAILDRGSGPTLISRQLLPDDTHLQPLGEWASMCHDVNGGWLPIVRAVCLGVALGGQTSYISFGVVDNMSVPAVLGASFMDIATKNIATQEQHVELLNGTKVPIRRNGARKGHPIASVSAVCACPQGGTAKLRPSQKTWVQPGTIAHIPVKSTYTAHGFVTGRPPLYHNHGIQVAQGPAIMVAGKPITVQVMHLGATPLRLTTDMTVGYIDPYEGPTYEVSPDELQERDGTSKEEDQSPLPGVDVSSVPDEWSGALRALFKKHAPMDMILAGVKWQICLGYLDDVLVISRSPEGHLQHLDEVLTRLGKAGVTLKAAKCHFFQEEVEYLGHVFRPGRVHVLEKNLRALRGLRYPETQTQMKSFLGMCGVYRRFVADFAKIAKPLTALTSTKLPKRLPPPREEESKAFEELRGRLLAAPILALPRRDGHSIVDVDASYEQLGVCLQQQQPDGEYHPIGYYSRALLPAEKSCFAPRGARRRLGGDLLEVIPRGGRVFGPV